MKCKNCGKYLSNTDLVKTGKCHFCGHPVCNLCDEQTEQELENRINLR